MKCPFLEEVVVRYCKAYPVRKMIPCTADESKCLDDEHEKCATYREVARVDVSVERAETKKRPVMEPETPPLKGSADFFPPYWANYCKVLNCPVCPYRFQCLGAERRWLNEPVFIHGFAVMRNLYYARWHTWLQPRPEKTVRIGLDDFSQKLLGNIVNVELPPLGTLLKKKETAWKVITKGWCTDILSPIDGEVIDVNPNVSANASVLNQRPYKTGWVIELKPRAIDESLSSLLYGEKAIAWITDELDRLHEQVETDIGTTIADGGELIDTISEQIDRNEWRRLVEQFLLTIPHKI